MEPLEKQAWIDEENAENDQKLRSKVELIKINITLQMSDTKPIVFVLWFPNLKGRKETAEGHEQFLWKSCKEERKEDPVV